MSNNETTELHSDNENDNVEDESSNPLADLIVPSDTEENEPPKPIVEGTFTFKEEESSESEDDDEEEDDDDGIELGSNPSGVKPNVKQEEIIAPTTTKKAKRIQITKDGANSPEKEDKKREEDKEKVITDDFWGKPIVYKKQNKNTKKKDEPAFEDEKQFEADLKTSIVEKEAETHLIVSEKENDDEFTIDQNIEPVEKPDLEAIKKKIKEADSKIPEIPKAEATEEEVKPEIKKMEEKPKEEEDIKPITSIPLTEISKLIQQDSNKTENNDDNITDKEKDKKKREKEPEFLVDKKKELDAIVEDEEGDDEEEDSEDENTQTITQSNVEITIPSQEGSIDNLPKVSETNEEEVEEEDEFIKREKRLQEDQKAFELNTKQITFATSQDNNNKTKQEAFIPKKISTPKSQPSSNNNNNNNKPSNIAKYKDLFNYFTNLDKSKYNDSIVIDDVSGYGCFAVFTMPKLQPNLVPTLPNIFLIAKCAINENDLRYLSLLQAIYCNITGSSKEVTRYGGHWVGIGFQGSDPGTDIRDTGTYGLLQLLYLSESNNELIHNLYVLSHDLKQNFPLCCVGINVTLALLKLLRERKLYKICNKYKSIEDAMNLIYCACMNMFYNKWKNEKLTIEKFQYALEFVTNSAEKKSESMIQEYTSSFKV